MCQSDGNVNKHLTMDFEIKSEYSGTPRLPYGACFYDNEKLDLLWSSPAPLHVNNHVSDFHRVQCFPDNSRRFPTKDLIHFMSSFSATKKRKKNNFFDHIKLPYKD